MAFAIIDQLFVTAIFIQAAVDPVGHEDRTEELPVRSRTRKSTTRILSKSSLVKVETEMRPWVKDTRLSNTQVAVFTPATANNNEENLTRTNRGDLHPGVLLHCHCHQEHHI